MTLGYPISDMVLGLKGQRLGSRLTAIQSGLELYECPLIIVVISCCMRCGRYVANKLLEFGDRDQLMKLVERVQGVTSVLAYGLMVRTGSYPDPARELVSRLSVQGCHVLPS